MLDTGYFTVGAEAYVQLFGDLGVGATPEDEGEDLLVFGGEPGLVGGLLQASRGLFLVARGQEPDAPPARVRSTASRSSSPEKPLCR